MGRNKKQAFSSLYDKVDGRIDNWATRPLSAGGKEVFIKSVLQAIPSYTMSCFLLPKTFCKALEAKEARFWWQKDKAKRGIHWCDWVSLCDLKEDGGMGFRDLCKFNIALLAKQGWRLVTRPNSLVARIMRAKYFPSSSFMQARLGSQPSAIWRSIWSSRGLLELGLRWQVGSGQGISIWDDVWLPGHPPRKIQTQRIMGLNWVSELMLPNSTEWDADRILAHFTSNDAENILAIPTFPHPRPDVQVWSGEHSGEYSVRSGYRLLQQGTINPGSQVSLYKQIWGIKCPSKIRIGIWKFVHNFIPTKHNLCIKRVATDPSCFRCNNGVENCEHLFRDCSYASNIWRKLQISWSTEVSSISFKDWLSWLFDKNCMRKRTEIAITLWAIWQSRNKLWHEGLRQREEELVTFVQGFLLEIEGTHRIHRESSSPVAERWKPPLAPTIKINVDAAYSKAQKRSSSGVVIRDSEGYLLGACHRRKERIQSAFAAEAFAVVDGLIFAADLGFHMVVVESDSRSVIHRIESALQDTSEIAPIIHRAKLLKESFSQCGCHFVHRSANKAAHSLAQLGFEASTDESWIEEAPASVEGHAAEDRRFIIPP